MSTTKYQVLARYYNTHTNNAVTNDSDNTYSKTFEFYTEDASSSIAELIMEGNDPQNVKNDMLFAYAGTKKVYPTDGSVEYAVEKSRMENEVVKLTEKNSELQTSITAINKQITEIDKQLNSSSKGTTAYYEQLYKSEYDTYKAELEKYQAAKNSLVESDGTVKTLSQWLDIDGVIAINYVYDHYTYHGNGTYTRYWHPRIYVYSPSHTGYGTLNITEQYGYITAQSTSGLTNEEVDVFSNSSSGVALRNAVINRLNVIINNIDSKMTNSYNSYESYKFKREEYVVSKEKESLNKIQVQETIDKNLEVIAEYNEVLSTKGEAKFSVKHKWPYMIIDVYERVWFSPWFSVHVCGSLTSALEKAKTIVNAIGIDNVKIIKLVDIDQFIRIR